MRVKIIYIMGDGRSGSTLIETILNNSESVVSVGECFRFWERFYKNETLCGCNLKIQDCVLWSKVHSYLLERIVGYNPNEVKKLIHEVLLYRNFNRITELGSLLTSVVREFYLGIASVSGKAVIIDSSKSPSWAKLLSLFPEFDVHYLHLERSLPFVVSSWKKKMRLPEFYDRSIYMPVKSGRSAIRTWIRVKLLSSRLKSQKYLFVKYEDLCNKTDQSLADIFQFAKLDWDGRDLFQNRLNHGIAGNPIRHADEVPFIIRPFESKRPLNISIFGFWLLSIINSLSKFLIR